MSEKSCLSTMLGPNGSQISAAIKLALNFLNSNTNSNLLSLVGRRIESIPSINPVDKSALQDSYGGKQTEPCNDLLAAKGTFYITEQGMLCLDCTSGHYQMLWGYNDPDLDRAINEAVDSGIVWDNHCNIPQTPVKQLAHRLVELANPPGERDTLDTVHLGCCTGSVACAAALKIQLLIYERTKKDEGTPVVIVLDGNYHGTDMVAQYLRGMWKHYIRNLKVIALQPNNEKTLQKAFTKYGKRVAGFWAEPVMMNREAIVVEPSYLQLARKLCDETGALMAIDEIQTGFWQPEIFMYRSLGFTPDLVIAGKGMAAGFHPQAAVIYRSRYDVLEQYDAISTNGSAPLPCYVSLCCLDKIQKHANRIVEVGDRYYEGMQSLSVEFPRILKYATGKRHMMGLKFYDVNKAIDFHKRAVRSGLWVRVHAYHEGHSTLLTKLPLIADEQIVDFIIKRFRALLAETK
jgi:acetylornithine/succinyldiaminopimelate/putrescine aminotransferase